MEKTIQSKKLKIFRILVALLLCLFCSFSFVGCVGRGSFVGSGNSSSTDKDPDDEDDKTEPPAKTEVNIDNLNDVIMGAIAVYDIDATEEVFYDDYAQKKMSFESLVDRQFTTIATYLSTALNRFYGNSTDATITIEGFGTNKSINMNLLISNNNQKVLLGLSNAVLTNSDHLNYSNAIEGGYKLIVTESVDPDNPEGPPIYTASYDINTLVGENAWKNSGKINIADIKKDLMYIYNNIHVVQASGDIITFAGDTDVSLRGYYSNTFNSGSINATDITSIGISREFIWNIAYYVAYHLIGADNVDHSVDYYNTVFNSNATAVQEVTSDAESILAFQNYKGYNYIISELVSKLPQLYIPSTTSNNIQVSNATSSDWDKTLFPSLNRQLFMYIDNIDMISDANNLDELNAPPFNPDDYKYEYDPNEKLDDPDNYEEEPVEHGKARSLKQIILLPYIDRSKYPQLQGFSIDGAMLGFKSSTNAKYQVEVVVNAQYQDGNTVSENATFDVGDNNNLEFGGEKIEYEDYLKPEGEESETKVENIVNNKLEFDNSDFMSSESFADLSFPLGGGKFDFIKTSSGQDAKGLITASFKDESETINYKKDSLTRTVGYIKVYNQLILPDGSLDLGNSKIVLTFNYYNSAGSLLSDIPATYLMMLSFY